MGVLVLREETAKSRTKHYTVATRLAHADLAKLIQRATEAELTCSDYLRQLAINGSVQPRLTIPAINAEQWEELGRMGANLNQISAALNARGVVDPFLSELLEFNRELLRQVREMLIGKGGEHGVSN